jgi:hypothetical protein
MKHKVVEAAFRVADHALDLSGGFGMFKKSELERLDERARILRPPRLLVVGIVARHLQERAAGQQANPDLTPAADTPPCRESSPHGFRRCSSSANSTNPRR